MRLRASRLGAISRGGAGPAPALDLQFFQGYVDGRIQFARPSAATRINASGALGTVAAGVPRIDFDPVTLACLGLLIEEQKTNLFLNAASATGGAIGVGTATGPDGAVMRAFRPNPGAATFPMLGKSVTAISLAQGATQDIAVSGFFAASVAGSVALEPRIVVEASIGATGSFAYAELQINTTTWAVRGKTLALQFTEVQAPTVVARPGGSYFVSWVLRFTQDAATLRDRIGAFVQARDSGQNGTFTADGVAAIQYAFCQAEIGPSVTSPIPTASAQATRAADSATIDLPFSCDVLVQDRAGAEWRDGIAAGGYSLAPRGGQRHIARLRAYRAGQLTAAQKAALAVSV